MSPIPTEDPVTRIPGLDAALKRKNAKKVNDVQGIIVQIVRGLSCYSSILQIVYEQLID